MSEDTEELKMTTIKLYPKHYQIIDENALNLSKWVRKKLEQEYE